MQKFSITIGLVLFILVTIIVLSAETPTTTRKVQFTNQNLVINNEGTEIANKDVEINLNKTQINNTKLATNDQNINFTNKNLNIDNSSSNFQNTNFTGQNANISGQNANFNNQNARFQNNNFNNQSSDFNNQNSNFDNQNSRYNRQKTRYNNSSINNQDNQLNKQLTDYERQQNRIKNLENSLKNIKSNSSGSNSRQQSRYLVKNIDWSTWKSNFVNKIVEDSVNIKELDDYGIGSWLYYSFDVDSSGRIYNVKVTSPYLLNADKVKVADMIKDYAYTDITIFPANSKRSTANVNAIIMLGESEKKSKPSDFKDMEKIRIKIN